MCIRDRPPGLVARGVGRPPASRGTPNADSPAATAAMMVREDLGVGESQAATSHLADWLAERVVACELRALPAWPAT
eukprot:2256980-Alexandrium_andersonii.AAC.1